MGNVPIKEFVMTLQEYVNVMRVLKGVHAKVMICFCWLLDKFWIIKYVSQIGPALVETYHALEMDNVTWLRGCAAVMLDIKDWIAQVGFDWFAFIGQKQGMQSPTSLQSWFSLSFIWYKYVNDLFCCLFNLNCIIIFSCFCAFEKDTSSACYCQLL